MTGHAVLFILALLLVAPAAATTPAYYTPVAHDQFAYDETVNVSNGVGNYSGYSDSTVINGSVEVTAVQATGAVQAYYYNVDRYSNNEGQDYSWTSSGPFGFDDRTFFYVNGTDNQTGYLNPTVWFYIDNDLGAGAMVTLLDSSFTVVSPSTPYDLATSAGGWVKTIFLEGNGSYERNDSYGEFNAQYNWKAYFDPSTGYIVAYLYTEQDSDAAGDGFTLTDSLAVTQTSYPLTPDTPASSSTGTGSGSSTSDVLLYAVVGAVIVVVILVVIVVAVLASRRRRLPRHSTTGRVPFGVAPIGPPPPPINLTPAGQPPVQQIIIKETVKVNCQYCGSLIDSTAEKCPFCGAVRT